MTIECGEFDAIWTKAKNNIGERHCVIWEVGCKSRSQKHKKC